MSSEWEIKKLKEIGDVVTGKTPSGKIDNAYDGEVLFLTPRDLTNEKVTFNTERTLSSEGLNDVANYLLPKNSVSVSCIGSDLGKVTIIGKEAVTNQQINSIIINDEVNHEYVYYDLSLRQNELKSIAGGSATPIINKSSFSEFEINLPPRHIQDQIVAQLAPFDQKIYLNRQTNETLEAMAQAIFKSWFVDFDPVRAKIEARSAGRAPNRAAMAAIAGVSLEMDWDEIETTLQRKLDRMTEPQRAQLRQTAELFPDELVESEIGEVPKGWGIKPFYDTIEIIGGGTPKTKIDEYWGGDILWYSVVDAPNESDVFVIDTEKKITESGLENSSAKLVDAGTTIISARGTVGKLALTPKPMTFNQSCYGLRSKIDCPYFNFYKTKQLVENLKRGSHGSVFDTITQKTFKTIDIAQPPETLENKFDEVVGSIMNKIQKNSEENVTLSQLRDTLLPKLISGEIYVKNDS